MEARNLFVMDILRMSIRENGKYDLMTTLRTSVMRASSAEAVQLSEKVVLFMVVLVFGSNWVFVVG